MINLESSIANETIFGNKFIDLRETLTHINEYKMKDID
jgi:hypothetical protein